MKVNVEKKVQFTLYCLLHPNAVPALYGFVFYWNTAEDILVNALTVLVYSLNESKTTLPFITVQKWFRSTFFMSPMQKGKKVLYVWNDMRTSTRGNTFNFCMNYPFKPALIDCSLNIAFSWAGGFLVLEQDSCS